MRVALSWLREYADLPETVTGRELASKLIVAGLEVETVEGTAGGLDGDIVIGEVREIEELTGFKKPIRYCTVDVGRANGTGEPQHVICGAVNFAVGDRVVVVLPGATLPGGMRVESRKTYGHTSHGMICSATELGLWEDHTGILVLDRDAPEPGADAVSYLGIRDEVLDIAVSPDRGYALSMRGVAREAATLYGVAFRDPADVPPAEGPDGYPARIADPEACDRFVLHDVSGFDPGAPTPIWMRRRLALGGMRSVSLAVDVTNYVMLELGQPLHAFDRTKLTGPIVVRRARAGERLETLDHVTRELDPDDILITDESGPISMAGTMGGLHTEIDERSTELVLEAAHFSAPGTARMGRRHKLSSESSRRFERGVDRELPPRALARAAELLVRLGGGTRRGATRADADVPAAAPITLSEGLPARVAGVDYPPGTTERRLREVGCTVAGEGATLQVTPPSWRPDLTDPNDLAEEVIRLEGYDAIPSVPPVAPAGRGLTPGQRLRREVGRTLAGVGLVEVLNYPFIGPADLDGLRLAETDPRRETIRLANPLSEDEPLLRSTLLPGLLRAVARNVGRGMGDVAVFEIGLTYHPKPGATNRAPILGVDRAPAASELARIEEALPDQPRRAAAVLTGEIERSGWWGEGRQATWADAIEVARVVAGAARVEPEPRAVEHAPWHPGRCAALLVADGDGAERVLGHAGELHPRTIAAFGLPERTVAMELDLDLLSRLRRPAVAPAVSSYPVAIQDVALVVDSGVPAAEVASALRTGGGALLEDLRLFDVYTGSQVGQGRKSLAYSLRFRAEDRTLGRDEVTRAREGAVAAAVQRCGAALRS